MRPTLSPAFWLLLCAIFVSFGEGTRLCGEALNKVLHDVCSFKGQDTPCFKGAFFDLQSLGEVRILSNKTTELGRLSEAEVCLGQNIRGVNSTLPKKFA
jgi:hypothetical protein